MKKIFLDDLPRKLGLGANKNKECIDWENSIGQKIKYIYNNFEGEIVIVNYNKEKYKLYINHNNDNYSISTSNFLNCKIGKILNINKNKYRSIHKYEVDDIIETRISKIKILEKIRLDRKGYRYECIECGNIDNISEDNIDNNIGCNVCAGKKVLKGVNDIWTTHPEIAKMLKYSERGHELSYGSGKSEIFICPNNCGYEKEYKISTILKGFSCPKCGDGLSYPNKFAFNLLEQLNLDFTPEYNPKWIKPKKYDFYFEFDNKKIILEMDGRLGHGYDNNISNLTAEESQAIDDYKDMKAKENGIEVIRIDCYKREYIKNNILNSRLNELFNLSKIDWDIIYKFALSSRVKEACDYWNNGIINAKEIGNIMKLSRGTIIGYLKQGTKFNWCDYDSKTEMTKNGKINGKNKGIPVIQLSLKGEYIAEFESASEAEKQIGIFHTCIIRCCNDKGKTAGEFVWMTKKDYENNKYIPYDNININNIKKRIVQLSLNNEFISDYNSIHEASNKTNIEITNISNCCNNKRITAGRYKWMFIKDYESNVNNLDNYFNKLKYKNNNCVKSVVQLYLNNEFIKEWNSINEAQNELKIKNITECCQNKRKTAGKFKWMYKEDYEKYIEDKNNIA